MAVVVVRGPRVRHRTVHRRLGIAGQEVGDRVERLSSINLVCFPG